MRDVVKALPNGHEIKPPLIDLSITIPLSVWRSMGERQRADWLSLLKMFIDSAVERGPHSEIQIWLTVSPGDDG